MTSPSERLEDQIIRLENELIRLKAAKLENLAKVVDPVRWRAMPNTQPEQQYSGGDRFYVILRAPSGWILMGPTQSGREAAITAWNTSIQFLNVHGRLPDAST